MCLVMQGDLALLFDQRREMDIIIIYNKVNFLLLSDSTIVIAEVQFFLNSGVDDIVFL